MRESYAVLKPGGFLAGYSIHSSPFLSSVESTRARELGPSFVDGLDDPGYVAGTAGFSEISVTDVTPNFRETCVAWIEAMKSLEEELMAELDPADYEEELRNKTDRLCGIEEGLLMRSLIVCKKE